MNRGAASAGFTWAGGLEHSFLAPLPLGEGRDGESGDQGLYVAADGVVDVAHLDGDWRFCLIARRYLTLCTLYAAACL